MITLVAALAFADPPGVAAQGERLAGLAGCVACHTAAGGEPLAGGHRITTRFGTFVGTNITPDVTYGIGSWAFSDFKRAMVEGRSPDGRAYWPAFPYEHFTHLDDPALADLWAWLRVQPPVARRDEPHEPKKGLNTQAAVHLWRLFAFRKGPLPPDEDHPDLSRGAWLAEGPGHCGGCHTPRNGVGVPIQRRALAGNHDPAAPNITPHPTDGIGAWTVDDTLIFLREGMLPDGDYVGGEMARIVTEGTARLSDADQQALAVWMLGQRPVADRPRRAPRTGDR